MRGRTIEVRTTQTVNATFLDIMECLGVNVRVVEHHFGGNTTNVQPCPESSFSFCKNRRLWQANQTGHWGMSNSVGSGAEDVEGVLEKECNVEGDDTACQEVLSSEILMKPRAWALGAGLEDARVMANTENNVELAG